MFSIYFAGNKNLIELKTWNEFGWWWSWWSWWSRCGTRQAGGSDTPEWSRTTGFWLRSCCFFFSNRDLIRWTWKAGSDQSCNAEGSGWVWRPQPAKSARQWWMFTVKYFGEKNLFIWWMKNSSDWMSRHHKSVAVGSFVFLMIGQRALRHVAVIQQCWNQIGWLD